MLEQLLTSEMVQFKKKVENWEEGIRIAAEPMVKKNAVEERYVEKMIENVKELGPYIVLMPNVAMPHARPEDGVHELSLGLLVLEEVVSFSDGKEVSVFLVLGANDASSHLSLLMEISTLLGNQEKVDALLTATSYTEILSIFKGE